MLFSTKAEYGVRLMVELGRRAAGPPGREAEPVALSTVAEAEVLPLSYLEHLVAKLRQAGLVTSVRGAHGGYRLARPRGRRSRCSTWCRRSRGRSRRWSASTTSARDGCSARMRADGDRACATKLLWTRVHGGITKALAGTTLADLVEFADEHARPGTGGRPGRLALRPHANHDNGDRWPIWRSETCM